MFFENIGSCEKLVYIYEELDIYVLLINCDEMDFRKLVLYFVIIKFNEG